MLTTVTATGASFRTVKPMPTGAPALNGTVWQSTDSSEPNSVGLHASA
jgi:hypothetical protein